jgi:glucose-6-phosphate 1-epimerase
VCSWKQASGDEVLYVRPDAVFDKSKPISGGIPHCFPQVGGEAGVVAGAAGLP